MRGAGERAITPGARERRRIRTPVLVVTAVGWLMIAVGSSAYSEKAQPGHDSMGMAMGAAQHSGTRSHMTMQLSAGSLPALLGMWLVMLTAMMSPLLIGLLRHLGVQSLARRRRWAWSLFVAGYAAVWALGGLLLLGAAGLLDRIGAPGVAAVSVAALWQFTPAKQRCLNRHHARPPLAAFGRKAELAALRFGAGQGIWCIGSCWALMLLPLVLHTHQLTVMAAVTLWIWAEQFEFPSLATWRVRIPTRALLIVRAAAVRIRWQPVQQPSPKVIS